MPAKQVSLQPKSTRSGNPKLQSLIPGLPVQTPPLPGDRMQELAIIQASGDEPDYTVEDSDLQPYKEISLKDFANGGQLVAPAVSGASTAKGKSKGKATKANPNLLPKGSKVPANKVPSTIQEYAQIQEDKKNGEEEYPDVVQLFAGHTGATIEGGPIKNAGIPKKEVKPPAEKVEVVVKHEYDTRVDTVIVTQDVRVFLDNHGISLKKGQIISDWSLIQKLQEAEINCLEPYSQEQQFIICPCPCGHKFPMEMARYSG